jgi:hypothetical protein
MFLVVFHHPGMHTGPNLEFVLPLPITPWNPCCSGPESLLAWIGKDPVGPQEPVLQGGPPRPGLAKAKNLGDGLETLSEEESVHLLLPILSLPSPIVPVSRPSPEP